MSFIAGVLLGLSLIVAIGAQNVWVLSQCMAGANRLAIALTCMLCDAALIVIGVFAANRLTEVAPFLLPWLTGGGVAMLLYLAWQAGYRAIKSKSGLRTEQVKPQHWWRTVMAALAISLLNPHVYLDTVVLLGSIGAQQTNPALFAVGACTASVMWFGALTAFSPKLKTLLSSPFRWRVFDSAIALILTGMAVKLIAL